ncbi:MAG: hypothetical protein ACP5D0_04925 [Hydrogenovibrio sp.]
MKKGVLLGLTLTGVVLTASKPAVADPAPFGLEVGQATISQMQEKYTARETGINSYSHGKMYELPTRQLGVSELKEATAIFDVQGKLVAILLTLPKHKFDSTLSALKQKYRLIEQQIPFVGNKKAVLKDGDTEITLTAPHMSFEMELNYINNDFYQAYLKKSREEKAAKRAQEASQL